jgi:hypothetical protein
VILEAGDRVGDPVEAGHAAAVEGDLFEQSATDSCVCTPLCTPWKAQPPNRGESDDSSGQHKARSRTSHGRRGTSRPVPKRSNRAEIDGFSATARGDGVLCSSLTYQEVILRLAARARDLHSSYVDYLAECYL